MAPVFCTKTAIKMTGRFVNEVISFILFSILDVLDIVLCYVYKIVDFFVEAEWKPCYCSSAKEAITSSGKILVSEHGGDRPPKVVCLTSTKLHLEEISDTLYTRPSVVSEVSKTTVNELKRLKMEGGGMTTTSTTTTVIQQGSSVGKVKNGKMMRSSFRINSTIVEMLQGRIGGKIDRPVPRWSDCDCDTCHSWSSCCKETLFVKTDGASDHNVQEDVIFIHGFISSSAFWTETIFPNFSKSAKSKYRFIAVDLLGFGRSPKPNDSLYTLREHLDMIEKSVFVAYKVKKFHIVAHSLGCILALALSVKFSNNVKSITLLAPPYFPAPKGVQATQHMMRRVAPRKVWPLIAFGASMACWYEHVGRTICLLICKNHRIWEYITRLITRNRIKTYLIDGFCCHTHNAAWHTLHNIICGTAAKIEEYLDEVRTRLKCPVTIFHGNDDELIPVECSFHVQSKIPRANVKIVEKKDHITIVVGRAETFARELEQIWYQPEVCQEQQPLKSSISSKKKI